MHRHDLSFAHTGFCPKLILDYLNQKPSVRWLYDQFPNTKGFEQQMQVKQTSFPNASRSVLVKCLQRQYEGISMSNLTAHNLDALSRENVFTVTTGHQLNLFTGPVYFLYKIVSTINLAKALKAAFPAKDFVPVYWMASEDHDFEEINHFFFKNTKISWDIESGGAVGKLSTEGLEAVWERFAKILGDSFNVPDLKHLFYEAYLKHKTLAAATRCLVNALFGAYGLVIVDGDDSELKGVFSPYMERELTAKKTFDSLSKTNAVLKKEYPLQVNPREINLFYCSDHLRERIVCQGGQYHINNTDRSFTKAEILAELKAHPERFSPNVVMRSLYQEVVLPNLCFVGGASELSYWLQLKGCFDEESVPYPILVLRNSVLFISSKQKSKRERLGISVADLFLPQDALLRKKTRELSPLPLDFSKQKEELKSLFNSLKPLVQQTDASFKGALDAQEQKQLKGMKNLEKRLLKAEKKRLSDTLRRIQELQAALFPNEGLQERNINFSELYLTHGKDLIPFLMRTLDPLKPAFSVLEI